jgi:hypothetical protein
MHTLCSRICISIIRYFHFYVITAISVFGLFTALVVKYITRRFIQEYDPFLGMYNYYSYEQFLASHTLSSRLRRHGKSEVSLDGVLEMLNSLHL